MREATPTPWTMAGPTIPREQAPRLPPLERTRSARSFASGSGGEGEEGGEGGDEQTWSSGAFARRSSARRHPRHQRVLSRTPSAPILRRTSSYGTYQAIVPASPLAAGLAPPPARESRMRWVILGCSCLLLFGNYYGMERGGAGPRAL